MSDLKEAYKSLPGVDILLASPDILPLLHRYGKELVTYCIRQALDHFRTLIPQQGTPPAWGDIIDRITLLSQIFSGRHLKKVVNATGVIIHTNLGRAPLGAEMLRDSYEVLEGYNNLEFNLETASRGSRNDHASSVLKYLTGAEDILVVNNAAAAVMLILRAFAKEKEVIVSRGELIEIGGSFRIPEIMAASDCYMAEVGTTNKTRLSDYEQRITEKTALLFKAHKSNYAIRGFTEEVSLEQLVSLGEKYSIPVLYDLGSGLLRKVAHPALASEPDVKEVLTSGVDMVCFSGDKLLGGPQAGIIAGKAGFISKLRKEPMLRALRVCKTTLALLETACNYYLNDSDLTKKNLVYRTLYRNKSDLKAAAELLQSSLTMEDIDCKVVPSEGQCGGGALPDSSLESFAVMLISGKPNKESSAYAENMYRKLLEHDPPVLGILKQGHILFDVLTISPEEMEVVSRAVVKTHQSL